MNVWLNVGLVQQLACEVNDSCSLAWSLILLILGSGLTLAVVPVQNRWISLNLESLTKLLLHGGVNLCKLDLALQLSGSLVPLWLESLAVATPWSVELHHPNVF